MSRFGNTTRFCVLYGGSGTPESGIRCFFHIKYPSKNYKRIFLEKISEKPRKKAPAASGVPDPVFGYVIKPHATVVGNIKNCHK